MKRIFWIYFALLLLGLIVLAWPEENNVMMVQLSETHGPSKIDLAGILIIMMGYVPMIKEVWKKTSFIKATIGTRFWNLAVVVTFIAMASIIWSLYSQNDLMLWLSVALATLAQAILIGTAYRRV
jgi:hypothetical protein